MSTESDERKRILKQAIKDCQKLAESLDALRRTYIPKQRRPRPASTGDFALIDALMREVGRRKKWLTEHNLRHGTGQAEAEGRQMVMYLAYEMNAGSFAFIGKFFDRDHSTVVHAHMRVRAKAEGSLAYRQTIDVIRAAVLMDMHGLTESLESIEPATVSVMVV